MTLRHTFYALALLFASAVPFSSAQAEGETDRRERQKKEAGEKLKQETQEKVQPSKIMADLRQKEHLQKAEEARNNKDEGTAQKEEQMAMMEQMKSQQLQQQIDANNKAANENEKGAEKLTQTDANDKGKAYDPNVVSVRKGDVPSAPGQSSSGGSAPGNEPPLPPAQLADLSTFSREALPQPVVAPTTPIEAPSSAVKPQTIDHLLGDLEKVDRAAVVFEDGAKAASANQGGATPQYRLLTSASGNEPSPTVTVSGGGSAASGGASGGANSNIWKSEETKPTRSTAARGVASVGGASFALDSDASLGALDKDFFEPCPDAKEWKHMSKQARGGVRDSCQKLAKQCEAKPADKKVPKGVKPKELTAECKEWLGQSKKTEKKQASK